MLVTSNLSHARCNDLGIAFHMYEHFHPLPVNIEHRSKIFLTKDTLKIEPRNLTGIIIS
jgi:hypothetical protein